MIITKFPLIFPFLAVYFITALSAERILAPGLYRVQILNNGIPAKYLSTNYRNSVVFKDASTCLWKVSYNDDGNKKSDAFTLSRHPSQQVSWVWWWPWGRYIAKRNTKVSFNQGFLSWSVSLEKKAETTWIATNATDCITTGVDKNSGTRVITMETAQHKHYFLGANNKLNSPKLRYKSYPWVFTLVKEIK